jgi:hypothetical protein
MKVDARNIAPFINRLEKFDKDVSKELKKEMRAAGGQVVSEARSLYQTQALRNWGAWNEAGRDRDLSFSPARAAAGVKLSTNRHRALGVTVAFGYSVLQWNWGAAVFELAGAKTNSRFTRAVSNRWGVTKRVPRMLGRAYYSAAPAAKLRMEDAVRHAMARVGM